MRHCEVAVLGLGLMGSAALYSLSSQGVDALGFDPLTVGEARGSSHGSCRVFRRYNFESESYDDLSELSLRGWLDLESRSGRQILIPSEVIEAGPPGSALVAASRQAAARGGISPQVLTGEAANRRFPAFKLPESWDVIAQEGGILLAEAAMHAFRDGLHSRIIREAGRMEATSNGIRIVTPTEMVTAQKAIVAVGPWVGAHIPGLEAHLKITRQCVGWFKPANPATVRPGVFPVFILDAPHKLVYGFPDFEGRGVKAARHDLGLVALPDAWACNETEPDLDVVGRTLSEFIPGAAGPLVERDVCLYTNTLAGDVRGGGEKEFVIDRLPQDPRIIVASPCSGHGAKFAVAIGEMLADLAIDSSSDPSEAFKIDRFSGFTKNST